MLATAHSASSMPMTCSSPSDGRQGVSGGGSAQLAHCTRTSAQSAGRCAAGHGVSGTASRSSDSRARTAFGASTGRRFPGSAGFAVPSADDGGRSRIPLRDSPGFTPGSLSRPIPWKRCAARCSDLSISANWLRSSKYTVYARVTNGFRRPPREMACLAPKFGPGRPRSDPNGGQPPLPAPPIPAAGGGGAGELLATGVIDGPIAGFSAPAPLTIARTSTPAPPRSASHPLTSDLMAILTLNYVLGVHYPLRGALKRARRPPSGRDGRKPTALPNGRTAGL